MLHGLDHGVYCHCSPLAQERIASSSSGNRNDSVGRNDCGIVAESEAVAAMVEIMAAKAMKLRLLQQLVAAGAKETMVLEEVEADTALAAVGARNN